mmetsp:Transcript_22345/g.52182  ORF Transcript_22345/g.52182 Transcript_22345/m.52182 type:complete len:286 (-) Transcript_22345:391-1248(-)|eukprot:CAMPEP_0114539968 /NCGR_PEP_ID=MMETSP0114-20121206/518_1 /TAXON_ID=31324 /ORGANISM="Goniomonas sp, Strain m" /LENGTH=285 /DNA_ID=CAMNT_0001724101 /DNA_START=98 /DNA_END=955 /DNA_ORIENTATION=-
MVQIIVDGPPPLEVLQKELFQVCASGCYERVKELIEANASLHEADPAGKTALHHACTGISPEHERMVELLLEKQAEPDAMDMHGNTSLMTASSRGSASMVQRLLDHGSSVDKPNRWGKRPIHFAVESTSTRVVQQLIGANAQLNRSDFMGKTELHRAAASGNAALVKLLLSHGSDPVVRDSRGNSALDHAKDNVKSLFPPEVETRSRRDQLDDGEEHVPLVGVLDGRRDRSSSLRRRLLARFLNAFSTSKVSIAVLASATLALLVWMVTLGPSPGPRQTPPSTVP